MALHFSAFRILALAASVAVLLSTNQGAEAKSMGPTAAAIVGGVAGIAVGAAIADANRHKAKKYYYDGYVAPYQPGGYDPYFDRAFRPSNDVTCYPAQRLCYNDNGSVAKNWSRRVFGY